MQIKKPGDVGTSVPARDFDQTHCIMRRASPSRAAGATCARCGYHPPVLFRSEAEMQTVLRDAGWICVNINGYWHIVCPKCRKENSREIRL